MVASSSHKWDETVEVFITHILISKTQESLPVIWLEVTLWTTHISMRKKFLKSGKLHALLQKGTLCRSEVKNTPWKKSLLCESKQGKEVGTYAMTRACFRGLFIGLDRNSAFCFTSGTFLGSKFLTGLIYWYNQYRLKNYSKNSMKSDPSMIA